MYSKSRRSLEPRTADVLDNDSRGILVSPPSAAYHRGERSAGGQRRRSGETKVGCPGESGFRRGASPRVHGYDRMSSHRAVRGIDVDASRRDQMRASRGQRAGPVPLSRRAMHSRRVASRTTFDQDNVSRASKRVARGPCCVGWCLPGCAEPRDTTRTPAGTKRD